MKKLKNILKLMRIKHYLKNGLIFLPLIFNSQLFEIKPLLMTFYGFISFCLISSAVYVINDIKDVEKDRMHKIKKNRPIASGAISIKEAILLFIVLTISSLCINIFIIKEFSSILLISLYLILNIMYSLGLKNIPIIDVVILVSGFVIRVIYGASITSIEISKWLYLTVMSGSFFMGFGKRRNEIIKQGNDSRAVLKYYTKDYLDKFMYACLVLTLMFYSLWSVDTSTTAKFGENMIYTIPLVMIIFMKYCLDIEGNSYGDPVDVITSDKILMCMVGILAISMYILIYVR
ncbi:MAG TPA: decaprenyl-phosphate phosphoribosyltransferase [Firmicutes bacterium]|nr:decaprenyl-phosphate phosphoribosyltransferase [Bacillota bacterium]